jgi:hypothetical protein
MLGERNYTLSSAGTFAVGCLQISGTAWVAIGDMNGDGVLNIATAYDAGVSASVLLGVGNDTFLSTVWYRTSGQMFGSGSTSVAIGVLHGERLVDIAATE